MDSVFKNMVKYNEMFEEIENIGVGAFSTVFKAKSLKNGNIYAVKKIPFKESENETTMREIEMLSKLKHEFVVTYIDSWIEKNYYTNSFAIENTKNISSGNLLYDPYKPLLLHIQMELCSGSLDKFIKKSEDVNKNSITPIDYSVACGLYFQLLKCIDYLHNQKPAIIHRDLKPENIVLTPTDEGFKVKVTDFGLSTYHLFIDQSHTKYKGTREYRAPEVKGRNYNTKADIYSLGRIMEDIFNMDHESVINDNDLTIHAKFENAKEICLNCLSYVAIHRPNCDEIIKEKYLWFYSAKESPSLSNNTNDDYYIRLFKSYYIKNKYILEFKQLKILGSGGFSSVYEGVSKIDNKSYAIKKIPFRNEDLIKTLHEIEFLVAFKSEFVVKYYESWIEDNHLENAHICLSDKNNSMIQQPLLLHIQMEYCPLTLKEVINQIKYHRINNKKSVISYYIASELLVEILEGVQFLHQQSPPIIHRDLKPENLLIIHDNSRFVKLSDFGLSTYHEYAEQTHEKYAGSLKYRAIEVNTSKYTTKADIYSLGRILQDLFTLDLSHEENTIIEFEPMLNNKVEFLTKLITSCLHPIPSIRPTCTEMLIEKHGWFLSINYVHYSNNEEISYKQPIETNIKENFIEFFMKLKIQDGLPFNDLHHASSESIITDFNDRFSIASTENIVKDIEVSDDNKSFIKPYCYTETFNEISIIGGGEFSSVFKSKHKIQNKIFAVKKFPLTDDKLEKTLKEYNFLLNLNCEFMVNYHNYWVELLSEENAHEFAQANNVPNYWFYSPILLYIQMDFCIFSLKSILKQIENIDKMDDVVRYYVASELFIEIIECLQYLHNQNPPIIHRNIKPENILINFSQNRYVKLSDFGVTTHYELNDHSRTANTGQRNYRAPELFYSNSYTQYVDIYSLGNIAQELFDIDLNSDVNSTQDILIDAKKEYVRNLIVNMLSITPKSRPNCEQILSKIQLWYLTNNMLSKYKAIIAILNEPTTVALNEYNFYSHFITNKFQKNSSRIPKHKSSKSYVRRIIESLFRHIGCWTSNLRKPRKSEHVARFRKNLGKED